MKGKIIIAVTTIIFFGNIESSSGADLRCEKDVWGEVICSTDGSKEKVRIKDTFWGEKEVLKDGKVVARCKPDIWGYTICK